VLQLEFVMLVQNDAAGRLYAERTLSKEHFPFNSTTLKNQLGAQHHPKQRSSIRKGVVCNLAVACSGQGPGQIYNWDRGQGALQGNAGLSHPPALQITTLL
jgi:hypothetical protein